MTKHSLARLIEERLREKGWRVKELSDRLGYSNPAKGDRRLRAIMERFDFLDNLRGEDRILKRLPEALDLPAADVRAAILATWKEFEAHLVAEQIEARRRFKPFLFVHTAVPYLSGVPLFIRAICEHLRVIELPGDFAALPPYSRIETARDHIRQYLDTHENLPVWGPITGFTLWLTPDDGLYFDAAGQPDYGKPCLDRPAPAVCRVKGRALPSSLFTE